MLAELHNIYDKYQNSSNIRTGIQLKNLKAQNPSYYLKHAIKPHLPKKSVPNISWAFA